MRKQRAQREGGRSDSPPQWSRRRSPLGPRSRKQSLEATRCELIEGGNPSKGRSDSPPRRRRRKSPPGPRSRSRSLEAAQRKASEEIGQERNDSLMRQNRHGSPSGPQSLSRSLEAMSRRISEEGTAREVVTGNQNKSASHHPRESIPRYPTSCYLQPRLGTKSTGASQPRRQRYTR